MKFEKTEVWGFEHALRGMRNPLESWAKSDGKYDYEEHVGYAIKNFVIGKNDLELAQKLIRAGRVHRKFLRQIFVSVDITAPLYWWKEFDTYKVGTVANSTSTMHKLASTPITLDCFEMDDFEEFEFQIFCSCYDDENVFYNSSKEWEREINTLEALRRKHNECKERLKISNLTDQEKKHINAIMKRCWKELIRRLPESWLQKRTVTMNYENLIEICSPGQRRNHKLTEWSKSFIDWAKSLPYANELLFVDKKHEVDFVMKYENGVYKCKYNSGEEFESSDGKTWAQIL